MSRLVLTVALLAASAAPAREGEVGVFGLGDPLELGVVGGPFSTTGPATSPTGPSTTATSTLLGLRLHGGLYTHRTLLGAGGGVEVDAVVGYALEPTSNYFWGRLDALANIGVVNQALGPFVVRLHVLAGFGFSLFSGTSLAGGGRLALGFTDVVALEAQYLVLPTINLTFAHRAQASLTISPIQLALGAQLDFGSAAVGQSHFSLLGTLAWRPKFD